MRKCKDCIHYQVCDWQVDAFNCYFYKAPTKDARECIEREPLLKFAKKQEGNIFGIPLIVKAIEDAPTVDVVPRNEGEWETFPSIGNKYRCSLCKEKSEKRHKYCPNCGAKMKGGEA